MVEVRLSARCHKTEDRTKVVAAMHLLFPDAEFEGDDPVIGHSKSLDRFGELLKQQRIRDAARSIMRKALAGQSTHFTLNKQVAVVGKVSFSQETHPLGDIDVVIEDSDIEGTIDKIAPNTRKREGDQ